ncbi:MAG: Multidrug resistance protein MdtA [Phycisphaerae bacterium]|nr:Multidrug resistance protein MdtA [Phycisphaerae bacterium]
MNATSELKQRLEALSIEKAQRPRGAPRAGTGRAAGRAGAVLLRLAFVAALGAGGYFAWMRWGAAALTMAPGAAPAEIRTLRVAARGDAEAPPVLTAAGKIVSDHRVQVVTKVSGQIVELRFEQGDQVTRGQVLARIEDVNYRARRDQAQAELEKSRANLAYQEFNFARVDALFRDSRASDQEHVDARRWLDDARAQVAAHTAALEFAQKALTDTEVIAPIAGVVLERNVEVGDFVAAEGGRGANANAQFASIADMSKLRVEVDVSELDIIRVEKGMRCVITPDAYKEQRYTGRVMWIDPGANYAKATVQVKVRIDNPDARLRVEGAAQVAFFNDPRGAAAGDSDAAAGDSHGAAASQPARSSIWIPESAIRKSSSGSAVFALVDGRARLTLIRTGRQSGTLVEVLDGLRDGDTIVADAAANVTDGQRVK